MSERLPVPRRRGELVVPEPPVIYLQQMQPVPQSHPPLVPESRESEALRQVYKTTTLKPGEVIEFERVTEVIEIERVSVVLQSNALAVPQPKPKEAARRPTKRRSTTPLWLLLVIVFAFLLAWAVIDAQNERNRTPAAVAPAPGNNVNDPFNPWKPIR